MEQKNKRPVNWMLRIAAILLCLVSASLYLVTGLYARYTTSATGSDGARVAKFEISMGYLDETKAEGEAGQIHSNPFQITMKPGEKQTRKVTMKNDSEVAVECILTAENTMRNLPLVLKWQEDGVADQTKAEYSVSLPANDILRHTYTLYIEWPADDEQVVNRNVNYSKEVDQIVVTILCQQID